MARRKGRPRGLAPARKEGPDRKSLVKYVDFQRTLAARYLLLRSTSTEDVPAVARIMVANSSKIRSTRPAHVFISPPKTSWHVRGGRSIRIAASRKDRPVEQDGIRSGQRECWREP